MGNYLPLLFILACPLMMIFMMRGMHGGHDMGASDQEPSHDEESNRNHRDAVRADQRIVDLERQVAQLRAQRDNTEGTKSRR